MRAGRRLRFQLEAVAAAILSVIVRPLPRRGVLALGRALGRAWAMLDTRHVAIAVDNLRRAFPDWTEARARRVAHGVYKHFACVLLDLLWLSGRTRDEVRALVATEGVENIARARAAGRGYLFVCAHFGSWEVQGVAHPLDSGHPIGVVARPLDNDRLDRRLVAVRRMTGNTVIYKQRALVQVMRSLRAGGGIAFLIDQNVSEDDGIFVDFFGRPAATTTVTAALAVKTGCALVPCYAVLEPDGRYRSVYEPPIEWTPSGDRERDIATLTQRMTKVLEGWIRERPEQWLWVHRRWKTQPRGPA